MAALALNSKTIPVTLPGDQARKLEVLAEREGRDASDIVAEAVQALWAERDSTQAFGLGCYVAGPSALRTVGLIATGDPVSEADSVSYSGF
jgi:hypothetical protein